MARRAHQPQGRDRLHAHRTGIGGEQAGHIGAEVAPERARVLVSPAARGQQAAIGQHHLEADHRLRRGAAGARAMKQAVLRKRAANRGIGAGKRPPIRGADAMRRQRLMQLLPGAARFDDHVHVVGVDLDHAVHLAHVDQHAAFPLGRVAARIAHAAAARDHGEACARGNTDSIGQRLDTGGLEHHRSHFMRAEAQVLRVEFAAAVIEQNVIAPEDLLQLLNGCAVVCRVAGGLAARAIAQVVLQTRRHANLLRLIPEIVYQHDRIASFNLTSIDILCTFHAPFPRSGLLRVIFKCILPQVTFP